MLQFFRQPLNELATDAVVHEVNCVGVSATPAAKKFDQVFLANSRAFKAAFNNGEIEPGKLFVFEQAAGDKPRYIFNLPTRVHWKAKINLAVLEAGFEEVINQATRLGISTITIGPIEDEEDGLPAEQIKRMLLNSFARIPAIQISVCGSMIDKPMDPVTIFTDGAAEPNPGAGGYGVVLRFRDTVKELSGSFRQTTNNRMELLAAIVGLEALKYPCAVRIFSDSRYVVDSVNQGGVFRQMQKMNNGGKSHLNSDLWKRFISKYLKHEVELIWVKAHSGVADNERCDALATEAIRSSQRAIVHGYLSENKGSSTKKAKKQKRPDSPWRDVKSLLIATDQDHVLTQANQNSSSRGPKPKKVGDPCRNCATPLARRETKKNNPKSAYYFTWHLHCPNCDRMYHVEEAKVYRT